MEGRRRIAILGSTGSIGTQTLDVIGQHPDMFEVVMLSAWGNSALLAEQAVKFDADSVVICDESKYADLAAELQPKGVKVFTGTDSLCSLVAGDNVDIVVGAMVGFAGLRPTLAALEAGKIVALANKETLVAAGKVVTDTMRAHKAVILPVGSEHSAIFECLMAAADNPAVRLHLTASGGPFRTWSREQIAQATAAQALKHPNWNMGAKVTIDSATMMNKGFEVMEARWLFDMPPSDIEVLVHPESIVHSMVEFEDGAVIAQLANPDMREPISFALAFPSRISIGARRLDLGAIGALHFEKPDMDRFPCLGLAYEALSRGGNIPCALNAANEVAVAAFLQGRISFYGIPQLLEKVCAGLNFEANPSLDDIFSTDAEAAARARELL
jgi:1-deoxy-D-xylulose-5-phosphate reductoisomerase